jgi:predicted ATPase
MRRFIITGAPGSGKTSILHELRDRGYSVVNEAATELISSQQSQGNDQPWNDPLFTEKIVELQRAHQVRPVPSGVRVQMYDRSPVCTLALARYLGHHVPARLADEIARIIRERVYEHRAFIIRPIGFCEPTAARRISYKDSLEFERYHEEAYARLGFDLVEIPPGEVQERAALIDAHITAWT